MSERSTKEIKDILDKQGISLRDVKRVIDNYAVDLIRQEQLELTQQVEKNGKYVGRYFKSKQKVAGLYDDNTEEETYIKVVSVHSKDADFVQCLCFGEKPEIHQRIYLHKACLPGDGIFANYTFKAFESEAIAVNRLERMKEISKKEYEEAARLFLDMLLDTEWGR